MPVNFDLFKDYDGEFTKRTINQHEYDLDFSQQIYIESHWSGDKPLEMARHLFGQDDLDERSEEFGKIKRYLTKKYKDTPCLEFDIDQLKFIDNNSSNMRAFDMAKVLFGNDTKPLSRETKTVDRFVKAIGLSYKASEDSNPSVTGYNPPNTDLQLIKHINSVDINANFKKDDLTSLEKECLAALRKYLNSHRFIATANAIPDQSNRNLFESSFVEACYNKPDLIAEELNAYISLCCDYVMTLTLQKQMNKINELLDDVIESDEDSKKLAMSLADAYSSKVQEYDKCQTRIQKLQASLSGSRINRMKGEASRNQSLSKLVEEMKGEESRKKMLLIAEARNLELEKEFDRIESAPEYIARVLGISKTEILEN